MKLPLPNIFKALDSNPYSYTLNLRLRTESPQHIDVVIAELKEMVHELKIARSVAIEKDVELKVVFK